MKVIRGWIALVLAAALTTTASTEGVWVLWLRMPSGVTNRLSTTGPTKADCLYVLGKLEPGAASGETLTCLPASEDPRGVKR